MRQKLLIFALLFFIVFHPSVSSAAQFVSGQDVKIDKTSSNLYVTGNTVKIRHDVKRDLVVAGAEVSIDSKIERGILAAGANVRVHSKGTGATVRVAGAEVVLSGKYDEDVVVGGNTVTIRDANIAGDLVVGAQTLIVENSNIGGNVYGGYELLNGDLKNQVKGKVFAARGEDKAKSVADLINFPWELSIILGLLLLMRFLDRRGKLTLSSVRFDRQMSGDILRGAGFLILPIAVLILAILTLLYPLAIPAVLTLYSIFVLTFAFLPIYIANFVKNSLKLKLQLKMLCLLTYAGLFLIGFIPFLRPLDGIVFVFALASYGYILRLIWRQIQT